MDDILARVPGLGNIPKASGFLALASTSDSSFSTGRDGVVSIVATGDRKVEFVSFADHALALVASAMGHPAYYPIRAVSVERPVQAVLMDLDGTTVRSESFWVWIIQSTIADLCGDPGFELEDADLPHVSGHSVSEHLQYGIRKYCPGRTVEEARTRYFERVRLAMDEILCGGGRRGAFTPAPGIRDFLLEVKALGVKIALVTSGLYEKAYPEILSAFATLGMGDPRTFYDCIITAGFPLRPGEVGTLGELAPKPHPWLYAEACRVGLGIGPARRHRVVGIEDSGAGICAIRLAGYAPLGIVGGTIEESGTRALCSAYFEDFAAVLRFLKEQ